MVLVSISTSCLLLSHCSHHRRRKARWCPRERHCACRRSVRAVFRGVPEEALLAATEHAPPSRPGRLCVARQAGHWWRGGDDSDRRAAAGCGVPRGGKVQRPGVVVCVSWLSCICRCNSAEMDYMCEHNARAPVTTIQDEKYQASAREPARSPAQAGPSCATYSSSVPCSRHKPSPSPDH